MGFNIKGLFKGGNGETANETDEDDFYAADKDEAV